MIHTEEIGFLCIFKKKKKVAPAANKQMNNSKAPYAIYSY